ncbi:MAG: 2Fe-2S iron-sulfur cluster-binding protein [Candidatus Thalassarchaeaceae archaeon]|tara:strand:+ start:50 stop:349 length:300 start_codon:yes stop_codon:yes gene_type:complete
MQEKNNIIRFFRGNLPLGIIKRDPNLTIVEMAINIGVDIPTNCTSGTCGTCLVRLKKGQIKYPDELPPGLDDYLVEEKGFLSCCMIPEGACEIDVIPPL